ncbi:hypothetical protein Tco_1243386 [Tanacetum coccineum]
MSYSEDSTVTYTEVSSPFVDLSDIRSSRVDGRPVMPEDPYAYVVAAFQAPPSPDYVPGHNPHTITLVRYCENLTFSFPNVYPNSTKYECVGDVVDFRTWLGISLETAIISTIDVDGVYLFKLVLWHAWLSEYINTPAWNRPLVYCDDDDDEDYTIAITPVLSTEEPVNSLIMEDEHLDTIPATESDEFIKSSVEILVPIPSESKGVPKVCDVPFHDNSPPLDISKDQSEDFSDSNVDSTSTDEDSFSSNDVEYVEASPPNSEPVSSKVMEIVIPEVGRIEDDILLIKDDTLREKLLNVNRLVAKIEALKDNPVPSSVVVTKSTSTFPDLFLEETNTFDNSLPELETFCFNLEEPSSGSPTTHSELSLPDYKAFYIDNDHFKEKE